MESRSRLWIGTSGWVYRHWYGVLYPPKLPNDQLLACYAERFPTVEINYSYYRLPERSVFETWRQQTPPDFLFAVKASRYLTHMKKLKDPEEPLQRLMERAAGLQEKLGPVLFQFPRTWRLNLDRLKQFTEALGPYRGQRFAFEFRHESWLVEDVWRLLDGAEAALCLPVGWGIPLAIRCTAPWTYVRMHHGEHGVGFSDGELTIWARRIRKFLDDGLDVYVYFNNDTGGHAIRDATRLRELLA